MSARNASIALLIATRSCPTCGAEEREQCHSLTSRHAYYGAWFVHAARWTGA